MSAIQNVSRRGFLKGLGSAGVFVLCVRYFRTRCTLRVRREMPS